MHDFLENGLKTAKNSLKTAFFQEKQPKLKMRGLAVAKHQK